MSLWYDIKKKSYASDGKSSWLRSYVDKIVAALKAEVGSLIESHSAGTALRHSAAAVDCEGGQNVQTALNAERAERLAGDAVLEQKVNEEILAREEALSSKVDKVDGKALSQNDYTDDEKRKLLGIEAGAQVNSVVSVAGKVGEVTLDKADVGLSNVNNTSDADKPISSAVQTALNLRAYTSEVIRKNNTSLFVPTGDYNPATKKYVDDSVADAEEATDEKLINYLPKNNTSEYTPSGEYNPSTKKYVDDSVAELETETNEMFENYLSKDNSVEYVPTMSYNPATKDYVDVQIAQAVVGGDVDLVAYVKKDDMPNIKKNPDSTDGDIIDTTLIVGAADVEYYEGGAKFGDGNVATGGIYSDWNDGERTGYEERPHIIRQNNNQGNETVSNAVLGGCNNEVSNKWNGLIGGFGNKVFAAESGILGGYGNKVVGHHRYDESSPYLGFSSYYNAIIGGKDNTIEGCESSVILGGKNNVIQAGHEPYLQLTATILGGIGNKNSLFGNWTCRPHLIGGTYCTSEYYNEEDYNSFPELILGNGTSEDARSNAFRVSYDGSVYGLSAFNSSGADYAEYFEWADGNFEDEDRRGLFVTLDGEKIRPATSGDDYILGVVSSTPSVVGDAQSEVWQGMYLKDVFGNYITEEIEVPEVKDDETGEVKAPAYTIKRWKLNPNYDNTQEYISRENRKEWTAVGMMGKLVVVDDGTCEVNGYCSVSDSSVATKSEKGYRVVKRIDENHIKIILKD